MKKMEHMEICRSLIQLWFVVNFLLHGNHRQMNNLFDTSYGNDVCADMFVKLFATRNTKRNGITVLRRKFLMEIGSGKYFV